MPYLLSRGIAVWAMVALTAPALARYYTPQGRCGEFDRVNVGSPSGTCVALVADDDQGLRAPRRILEVAPQRYWIVDMGSWERHRGRLLEMTLPPPAPPTGAARRGAVTVLAERLDRPLGLALGPDNKVYVAEAGRIWRAPVPAPGQPLLRETLIEGLPDSGAHPLKELAFGPAGRLYINIGSGTDSCQNSTSAAAPLPCPELSGDQPRAAVYEALLDGPQFKLKSFKPLATGLRNSLALAVLPNGSVLQGENNIDYSDANQPAEELNLLRRGRFYGWPYCLDQRRVARGYEGRYDCQASEAPLQQWPAHAAPLQMIVAPAASPYAGQLLVAWHGYRSVGHRVMRIPLNAAGRPVGAPQPVLSGWGAQPPRRPLGKPAGLTVDRQGRLLVVEDTNRTVLMILPDAAKPVHPSSSR